MKKILFIGVIIMLFIISGCAIFSDGLFNLKEDVPHGSELLDEGSNKEEFAIEICANVLKAIENKDKETLKSFFSKQALAEAENFDAGVEYVFDLCKGTDSTITRGGAPIQNHHELGKNSSYTELNCDFSISENNYHIYFEYWFENEANHDAVGIYSMKICELEVLENTENFDVGWKNPLPGIYYPAWDEKVVE